MHRLLLSHFFYIWFSRKSLQWKDDVFFAESDMNDHLNTVLPRFTAINMYSILLSNHLGEKTARDKSGFTFSIIYNRFGFIGYPDVLVVILLKFHPSTVTFPALVAFFGITDIRTSRSQI